MQEKPTGKVRYLTRIPITDDYLHPGFCLGIIIDVAGLSSRENTQTRNSETVFFC